MSFESFPSLEFSPHKRENRGKLLHVIGNSQIIILAIQTTMKLRFLWYDDNHMTKIVSNSFFSVPISCENSIGKCFHNSVFNTELRWNEELILRAERDVTFISLTQAYCGIVTKCQGGRKWGGGQGGLTSPLFGEVHQLMCGGCFLAPCCFLLPCCFLPPLSAM